MHRKYIDSSNFHAILELPSVDLRGNDWPEARSYFDTSQLRSPYKHGFFQDNTLRGLGVTQTLVPATTSTVPSWLVIGGSFLLGFAVAKTMFRKPKS
jgi:hypothetical protein